jgi:multiple sugar transport system permease protein
MDDTMSENPRVYSVEGVQLPQTVKPESLGKSTRKTPAWKEKKAAFLTWLLIPSLVLLTLITILPIIYLIATSFTSWDLSRPDSLQFIGLKNFLDIFTQDERFWNSVTVQIKLTFLTVPFTVLIGLGLAIFLREKVKNVWLLEFSRGVFLVPMVIPPIVAALIWKILFTPPVSILNYVITRFGMHELSWLGDPRLALVAIAIATVWEFFPFCFLLLYAGLISLSEEPLEAARVDGASGWQIIRYVTVPMLKPTLSIVILFQIIDSIRAFPMIYMMTGGGPGFVTEPTNFYAYQQSFNYSYIGYSSALIIVMLILTVVITALILNSIHWNREAE